MNTVVQAGPLTTSVVAIMVNANVSVSASFVVMVVAAESQTACLDFTRSINGHSISSINPHFVKVGELTTLIAA